MFMILALGIGIILLLPTPENAYHYTIIDKHRLLSGIKNPKIVFAGGSNVAYGIDSAKIQGELHIQAVNMGLNADIGLGRILYDISPFLNSGDILLIAPEYEHFTNLWNGSEGAYELIFGTRQYRLLWSPYFGIAKVNGFFNYLSAHLWDIIRWGFIQETITLPFLRNGFNEYGDYINHLEMENQLIISNSDLGTLNRTYSNYFFQLVDNFSIRGITVLLSYPSYEEQSFRNSARLIQELDAAFRANENLLVISTPESYCYPVNYFYDTPYHLNKEGRSVRTDQLIQDLQASDLFLNNPQFGK